MNEKREYLVCVDNKGKERKVTKGRIYIVESSKQVYPIRGKDNKREFYSIISDRGCTSTLYGSRFKVLKQKENTNAM